MAAEDPADETISVPLDVARYIYAAFLPLNPNKMRGADPAVVESARRFKALVEAHGNPRAALAGLRGLNHEKEIV